MITLDYERLENHCTICMCLSHDSSQCPSKAPTEWNPVKDQLQQSGNFQSLSRESKRQDKRTSPQKVSSYRKKELTSELPFQQRRDIYGNIFGARARTKQTRIRPPEKTTQTSEIPPRGLLVERREGHKESHTVSPQYVHYRKTKYQRRNLTQSPPQHR